jgi:hypothetical protein
MDILASTQPDLSPITQRLADDSTRINNLELGMGELTEHVADAVDLLDSTLSVQEATASAALERKRDRREAALRAVLDNASALRERAQARKARLMALMP